MKAAQAGYLPAMKAGTSTESEAEQPRLPFMLPCGHSFCEACIMEWLKKKPECPGVCPVVLALTITTCTTSAAVCIVQPQAVLNRLYGGSRQTATIRRNMVAARHTRLPMSMKAKPKMSAFQAKGLATSSHASVLRNVHSSFHALSMVSRQSLYQTHIPNNFPVGLNTHVQVAQCFVV